jgi:putative transposase
MGPFSDPQAVSGPRPAYRQPGPTRAENASPAPQANAICERLLGTLRRECLDLLIPLTENHLRRLLHAWRRHDNVGCPPMSLGPGIPQPPAALPVPLHEPRHRMLPHLQVVTHPVLGGLHHDYRLEKKVA